MSVRCVLPVHWTGHIMVGTIAKKPSTCVLLSEGISEDTVERRLPLRDSVIILQMVYLLFVVFI